jgi:DNA-binding NarL/FixJ family response regulator
MLPTKLLIADDNQRIVDILQSLLEMDPTLEIVGTALDGIEVLDLVEKCHPEILIVDLSMPVLDGFAVLQDLKKRELPIHVIVFTANLKSDFRHTSLASGIVDAIVSKADPPEDLPDAVHQIQSKIRLTGRLEDQERFWTGDGTSSQENLLDSGEGMKPYTICNDLDSSSLI